MLPSDQRRVIEQAQFTYSPLGKALEKQAKASGDRGEKQMKANENAWKKKLVESNELLKNDFNINRDGVSLKKQK